jgi:hypothetical protein
LIKVASGSYALHLASMEYLRTRGEKPRPATYDERLLRAARALRLAIFE